MGMRDTLNNFEVDQLLDLQKLAADHHVNLILLAPPTAAAEVFDEFRAVTRADESGKLTVPLMSFADPITYYDLYDPKGFTDPDHVGQPVSRLWSLDVARKFVELQHVRTSPAGIQTTEEPH